MFTRTKVVAAHAMAPLSVLSFVGFEVANAQASTPTISDLNPTSAAAGAGVTIYGTNLYGDGIVFDGNAVTPTSQAPSGTSETFVVPTNGSIGSHTIQIAEKGTGALSGSATLSVIPNTSPISLPASMPYPETGSKSGDTSAQVLQQQLTQLLTLFLQLLQQAAAKGLLNSSQLDSTLNSIAH